VTDLLRQPLPPPLPASPAAPIDVRDPSLYLNRELSWLEFNGRVLHEALDPRTPLLERLKFVAIFSSNLDEFFQVRVAGLKQQAAAGIVERTADGMTPEDQLSAISTIVRALVGRQRRCLMEDLLPALAEHGLTIYQSVGDLPPADRAHVDAYFHANVFPVLTPLAVDPGHPFPYISNLSLSLAVVLRGADGEERFARVKVPKILPRWVPLTAPNQFVPLEEVIGVHLEALFPGVEILGWYTFRITRNTDLQIDHGDEADDLLSLIQEEVRNRRFAEVVRIEVHASMPSSLRELLLMEFSEQQDPPTRPLTHNDVYEFAGFMDTADLLTLSALDLPALRDPVFHPVTPPRLGTSRNIFDVIREGDLLPTIPTTASRPRWSDSFRRPPKTPMSSRSSSPSTGPGATRASRGSWHRRPSGASRWRS
jgi:polyphosphate kinase